MLFPASQVILHLLIKEKARRFLSLRFTPSDNTHFIFIPSKMWRLEGVIALLIVGVVTAQEPLPQQYEDTGSASDLSPPLSAEDGLTILGTGAVDVASTLSCHRRMYSYRVTKTDSAGRKCWGQVNVMSCWGRCDSNEVPDFRFPYKKSHHPVCIFGSRKPNSATLENCDDDVEPGTERYDYQEAESCHCSVCKSSEASCEGMRYRGVRSGY